MKRARTAGFTLIEILVALVILMVVSGLLLRTYQGSQRTAYDGASANCLQVIGAQQALFRARTGGYASHISQLGGDVTEACTAKGVQVTGIVPTVPVAATPGNGAISLYGGSYIYYTWHPQGSMAFLADPPEGIPFGKRPYP